MKFKKNVRNCGDGLVLLNQVARDTVKTVFFDPQYRGVLDKLKYGNEGARQKRRALMIPMDNETITSFVAEIARVLKPSGYLFLWVDKFHLVEGVEWADNIGLEVVDMITWDKQRIGMGYRSRRRSEYLLVYQKPPKKAKVTWSIKNIPDVWQEKILNREEGHPHKKPISLITKLIEATTKKDDLIIDPAAGSYTVMKACILVGRNFLGCDIKADAEKESEKS